MYCSVSGTTEFTGMMPCHSNWTSLFTIIDGTKNLKKNELINSLTKTQHSTVSNTVQSHHHTQIVIVGRTWCQEPRTLTWEPNPGSNPGSWVWHEPNV